MSGFVLGIDGGTECIKAGIFNLKGDVLAIASTCYETLHKHPGWAEQRVIDWREGLIKSIKKVIKTSGIDPGEIAGIGYDGTTSTIVFLDGNNKPVRNSMIWMDVRASEEAKFIGSVQDPAREYDGHGKVSAEWFPCKILWLKKNQPENYRKAKIIAEYTDWLTHEFTDNWTISLSTASFRGYYNNRNFGWPKKFYEKIGLGDLLEKLPSKVLKVGELVGGVSENFSKKTGIPAGTPVAQGGYDALVGSIGSNAFNPGQIFLITGSSNVLQIATEKEFHTKGLYGSYPDLVLDCFYIEGGQTSTGSVLKWFTSQFINKKFEDEIKKSKQSVYYYMDDLAKKIPIGSEGIIIVEHWQGNRTPFTDSSSRGIIRGLSLKHGPVHIYRAIMEASAYDTEATLRVLKENNFKFDEIIACGGHMKSELWKQIYSDVLGLPLKVTTNPEASTLGSAILGSVAAGKYKTLKEAAANMVQFEKVIMPNMENNKKYQFFLDQYIKTYYGLKDHIHETNDFINDFS